MAKLPKTLLIAALFLFLNLEVNADSLVAPISDAARFAPEPAPRRRPASVLPIVDEPLNDSSPNPSDADGKDEETEAAWMLPQGYSGGPGCDNCSEGIRPLKLEKLPLELIEQGGR